MSFPRVAVFQEQAAPAWVHHRATSPASISALPWASLHRATGPAKSLFQCWFPTGSQLPSGIHLLWRRVPSMGYRWISAPATTSKDCMGQPASPWSFITSCMGRLCYSISSTSSFFTDLGVCKVVSLPLSHSSLSTAVSMQVFFLPLLKHVVTEAL